MPDTNEMARTHAEVERMHEQLRADVDRMSQQFERQVATAEQQLEKAMAELTPASSSMWVGALAHLAAIIGPVVRLLSGGETKAAAPPATAPPGQTQPLASIGLDYRSRIERLYAEHRHEHAQQIIARAQMVVIPTGATGPSPPPGAVAPSCGAPSLPAKELIADVVARQRNTVLDIDLSAP